MLKRAYIARLIFIAGLLSLWSSGSCHLIPADTRAAAEQQLPPLELQGLFSAPAAAVEGLAAAGAAAAVASVQQRQHHPSTHKAAAVAPPLKQTEHRASQQSQQQRWAGNGSPDTFPAVKTLQGVPLTAGHFAAARDGRLLVPAAAISSTAAQDLQHEQVATSAVVVQQWQQQQQRWQQQRMQQRRQQQQQQVLNAQDVWGAQPPAPPPWAYMQLHESAQCEEYHMPPHSVTPAPDAAAAIATAAADTAAVALPSVAAAAAVEGSGTRIIPTTAATGQQLSTAHHRRRRQLLQLAPQYCGKLGTYVPNYYSKTDGSMFGISIAPSWDGSVIAVGSPINGPDAQDPGGASVLTSWSDKTCEYAVVPVWQPDGCYKYFGAQVALSTDGTTMVVMDGVEGIKTPTAEGNRPVVHVYRRYTNGTFVYMQKLPVAPRRAMAAAMAVSITGDAQTILVSFSVGEGFPDKRGSAQIFVLDGTHADAQYSYLQDLANLNMPAGTSVQFGQTSVISNSGAFIAVGTAANNNAFFNLAYMYKKDAVTGRFRIISSISSGESLPDPSPACTGVGLSESNIIAMSQSGRFVAKVENAMLVIYEWSGHGMTVTWKRRCQLQAPDGYTFRTTAGALSIVEVGHKRVKFAAGAYVGTLEAPEQMAVFLYYLNVEKAGTCPYRPAEKHVHNDAFSNYGAGVALSLDGRLLIVGAPSAWDNNMDCQNGAVYLIDICEVADDGLEAKTVTQATNTNAGCVNGVDANGNPCVTKQKHDPICKDVKLKDGRVIHYGAPGCAPTPSLSSQFWASSLPGPAQPAAVPHAPFSTAALSAYTTVAPSLKGGVGVPVGSDTWLANQAKAAVQASYFGVPTAAITKPRDSVVSAQGWPSSVQPALGGLKSHLNTVGSATAAPPGISALSLLSSGIGALINKAQGGNLGASGAGIGRSIGIGAQVGGPVLPAGAVIRNMDVLRQQPPQTAASIAVPAAPTQPG